LETKYDLDCLNNL